MSKRGVRRPTEEEALGRITRWEDRVKRGGFDTAYYREFDRLPIFVEEPIKETEIVTGVTE